jgi:hypothetical protein
MNESLPSRAGTIVTVQDSGLVVQHAVDESDCENKKC